MVFKNFNKIKIGKNHLIFHWSKIINIQYENVLANIFVLNERK